MAAEPGLVAVAVSLESCRRPQITVAAVRSASPEDVLQQPRGLLDAGKQEALAPDFDRAVIQLYSQQWKLPAQEIQSR